MLQVIIDGRRGRDVLQAALYELLGLDDIVWRTANFSAVIKGTAAEASQVGDVVTVEGVGYCYLAGKGTRQAKLKVTVNQKTLAFTVAAVAGSTRIYNLASTLTSGSVFAEPTEADTEEPAAA